MNIKVSNENRKIGKDTFIINMNSAKDCPSRLNGLCQLDNPDKCYALKAERQYPSCLPYRKSQEIIWNNTDARDIADQLLAMNSRKRKPVKYLRFSEAGDFKTQADIDKMDVIARILDGKIRVYGYTARCDLDYSKISSNMIVNGSGFMATNEFKAVTEYTSKIRCAGNCRICNLCKHNGYKNIQVLIH